MLAGLDSLRSASDEPDMEFVCTLVEELPDLYRYCRFLTKSAWDADDLLQETLLRMLRASRLAKPPQNQAFLRRVAKNAWIDMHRKRKVATTPLESLALQTSSHIDWMTFRSTLETQRGRCA